jgi:hypothetical protein
MSDSLMPKILLLITFAGLFSLIGVALQETVAVSIKLNDPDSPDSIAANYFDAYSWDPDPKTISSSDVVDFNGAQWNKYVMPSNSLRTIFTKGAPYPEDDIQSWYCEDHNTHEKFLYMWIDYKGGLWIGNHHREAKIPVDDISDAYNSVTNYSKVYFNLRHLMQLDVTFDNTTGSVPYATFDIALNNNAFNFTLSTPMNVTIGSVTPWSIVDRVLTLRLPDTPWQVSVLLAVPIYGLLGIVILATISKFIPLIQGF